MAAWCLFLVVNVLACSALSGLALGSPSSDVAWLQELLRKWKATVRPDVFENWRLDEDSDPCTERRNDVACSRTKFVIHLLLHLCSEPGLTVARNLGGSKVSSRFISNELKFLSHRALLQVVPIVTPVPTPAIPPPAPAPVRVSAPPTPVRTYLMWAGTGAFCLVLTAVAVFCLCRKFEQQKIRGAQRLPPLPRYN